MPHVRCLQACCNWVTGGGTRLVDVPSLAHHGFACCSHIRQASSSANHAARRQQPLWLPCPPARWILSWTPPPTREGLPPVGRGAAAPPTCLQHAPHLPAQSRCLPARTPLPPTPLTRSCHKRQLVCPQGRVLIGSLASGARCCPVATKCTAQLQPCVDDYQADSICPPSPLYTQLYNLASVKPAVGIIGLVSARTTASSRLLCVVHSVGGDAMLMECAMPCTVIACLCALDYLLPLRPSSGFPGPAPGHRCHVCGDAPARDPPHQRRRHHPCGDAWRARGVGRASAKDAAAAAPGLPQGLGSAQVFQPMLPNDRL
jgi:hypothetical protein